MAQIDNSHVIKELKCTITELKSEKKEVYNRLIHGTNVPRPEKETLQKRHDQLGVHIKRAQEKLDALLSS